MIEEKTFDLAIFDLVMEFQDSGLSCLQAEAKIS